MRRSPFIFCLLLFAVAGRVAALGVEATVTGEIGGELKLFARNPEFVLPWKMSFGRGAAGEQSFSYKIDAAGTQLGVSGRINLATGEGSWHIDQARVDAAVWLGLLAPRLGEGLKGVSAQGFLTVSGDGTLHNGEITGRLVCTWRDGVLVHAEQGWKLEGISFNGEFAIDAVGLRGSSTAPFELKIGTIAHPRFGARNLELKALLTPQRTLQLLSAQVEIAGGELFVDPAEVALIPPVVDLNLRFQRVGLQDIVLLVPAAGLSDARGRIDGVVRLKWSDATGLKLGLGHLALRNDEPAIVRLSPNLGLLTGRVPQYIDLLPVWMGPLARWVRPENPAYGNLSSIELGKSDLRVTTLSVQLTPEGDDRGRSATVKIAARPNQSGGAVKEVTFDVNVAGPLDALVKVGMEQNFSIDAH
ncbi:MAG: YdbH domain-containing protein [Nibricoccus sp.]